MTVVCQVFVDGGLTEELQAFASVPRAGDKVLIRRNGDDLIFKVDSVLHVAKGVASSQSEPSVQVSVSTHWASGQ